MKPRSPFLIVLGSLLLISTLSLAQDNGGLNLEGNDERDRLDRERIISSPGESERTFRPVSNTTNPSPKDSAVTVAAPSQQNVAPQKAKVEKVIAPVTSKPIVEKHAAKQNDDSILSFNFLYYIIEKYKLQDVVD